MVVGDTSPLEGSYTSMATKHCCRNLPGVKCMQCQHFELLPLVARARDGHLSLRLFHAPPLAMEKIDRAVR